MHQIILQIMKIIKHMEREKLNGLVLETEGLGRLAVIPVVKMESSGGNDAGKKPGHDNEKEERSQRQKNENDGSNDSMFCQILLLLCRRMVSPAGSFDHGLGACDVARGSTMWVASRRATTPVITAHRVVTTK